jgi:hypothetical protein
VHVGIWAAGGTLETPAESKKRMLAMDPVRVPLAVELNCMRLPHVLVLSIVVFTAPQCCEQ